MKNKYYRKKIALVVVIFTFIPTLLFANLFYRDTYNNRMNTHLEENQEFMLSKTIVLTDELSELNTKLKEMVEEIKTTRDGKERRLILERFVKANPHVESVEISPKTNKWVDGEIRYDAGPNHDLWISYSFQELTGLQEVIRLKTNIGPQVNWFTENAINTYFIMVSLDEVILASPGFEDVNQTLLKNIDTSISFKALGSEGLKYYSLKKILPQDNLEIFIFRTDNTAAMFRSFYMDYILKIVFMLLLSVVVTYVISLHLSYPFEKIKRAAESIIAGDYDTKVEHVEDELLNLNLSFNKMAKRHREKNEEFVQYAMTMLERNENLTDLNQQLEASYDQLKAITEMLEYSKDKYQALFDHIKEFIWVINEQGEFTYVNNVMHEKLNYEKGSLIGRHFFDVFSRFDDDEKLDQETLIDQFLRRDYSNISFWFNTEDGHELLLSANSKRVFKNGVIEGAQGTARTVEFEEMLQNRVLRKNREFEIVKEITWSLANITTLDALFHKVTQKVEELFLPELCTIRIVEGDNLVFKAGLGNLTAYARTDTFSIHDDFSGLAIKENRIIRIIDFDSTHFYNRSSMQDLLEKLQEIIVIPLENKGKIHGTINIGLSAPLTDAEIKIIKTLSNQASIGIEKVLLYDQLKEDYLNTIRVLASAVEAKDKYTEGHSTRVSLIAKCIGQQMTLETEAIEELEIAGMLHDIGKIGIHDEILTKEGSLTDPEYDTMKSHPAVGKRILDPIGLSDNIIEGVYLHHKRFDLTGYPEDVSLEALSLYPAVIGVADAFDAMTSKRTYSSEKSLDVAMAELARYSGQQFCPKVVHALEEIVATDKASILEIIKT